MTEPVWLSVAPQKTELTSFYRMEDRAAPAAVREDNAMFHRGGGHLDPKFLPQRPIDADNRKEKLGHLFRVNGFLCVTEKAAAVLRQFDLGTGGLYPVELVRDDEVTPVDGFFWALNFGEKKTALAMEESRAVDGPNGHGNCRPKLWVKDDDFAVTRAALDGSDLSGDRRVESGVFISPRLGQTLHKARLCTRPVSPRPVSPRPSTSSAAASFDGPAPPPRSIAAQSHHQLLSKFLTPTTKPLKLQGS